LATVFGFTEFFTAKSLTLGIKVLTAKFPVRIPAFAITLETVLGTSAEMWVRMQAEYDLWEARQKLAS